MKNIVFITAIKSPGNEVRSEGYKYSIESWKHWCRANGAELRVLDQALFNSSEMKPNYFRYYCFNLLEDEGFDQICLVDADTIIHPECPNFFELHPDKFRAVHNDGDYDWIIRSIENYQYEFQGEFKKKFDIWKYFNSGFLVFAKKHEPLIRTIIEFYWENSTKIKGCQERYGVGTDQPLINLLVNEYYSDALELLPYQFNMQDLPRKNILDDRFLFTKIPGIYHFNAIPGGPTEVNKWMRKTNEYLTRNNI